MDEVTSYPVSEREETILRLCHGDKLLETTVRGKLEESDKLTETVFAETIVQERKATYGHYQILNQIGEGGMGVVYRAKDTKLKRTVALKFLSPVLCQSEKSRRRFTVEAQAISKIDHPNVCAIFDINETEDGQLYFAMPYYEGDDLKRLFEKGEICLAKAIELTIQICQAIAAAHEQDVIHRDIKPANVHITKNGIAKVIDFGLAKMPDIELTQTGQVLGTTIYMSPEQLNAVPLDHRTDIWSLGVLFYELLSGKRPFNGKTVLSVSQKIMKCSPVALSQKLENTPEILDKIISKTLRLDPNDRYATVNEMIEDLEKLEKEIGTDFKRIENSMATEQDDEDEFRSKIEMELEKEIEAKLAGENSDEKPDKKPADTATTIDAPKKESSAKKKSTETVTATDTPKEESSEEKQSAQTTTSDAPKKAPSGSKKKIGIAAVIIIAVVIAFVFFPKDGSGGFSLGAKGAVTKDSIRLGMTAAFSGPSKELGHSMKIGIETRLNEINDAGGIHGRKISLLPLDDGYEPEKALKNIKLLLSKNTSKSVFALIGNVGTPTAKVILPETNKNKMLLFGTFSGAKLLRNDPSDKYVFNYRASYTNETEALVRYFVDVNNLKANKIAVFYQDDSYGKDGFEGIKRALHERGVVHDGEIKSATYKRNTIDVDEAVKHLIEVKESIDAIIIIGSYKASALFTKKMRREFYIGKIANVSFVGSKALASEFKLLGKEFGEGIIVSQVVPYYDSESEGVIKYREALEKYHPNEKPNFVSLEGYIIASIFCEALQINGPELTTESLIKALYEIDNLDLGIGPTISFTKSNHQASRYVWGARLNAKGDYEHIQFPRLR
ncbi:MAG: ABC transporter substrate-binding protein [Lentisphaeria bacterium]|nr:ABC transporter substrate-binding protein [Lentisphaeria bacterium]